MRILMLAQFYPPMIGGEERHVKNLSTALARRGHDVHVATLQLPDAEPPSSDVGVRVHCLASLGRRLPFLYSDPTRPMAAPLPDPILGRELFALAERVDADVVHAHNWIVNSYLPLKPRFRAPLVLSLHDYSHVCATKRLMVDNAPCAGPAARRCVRCAASHYSAPVGVATWAAVNVGRVFRNRWVDRFTPVSRFVAAANGLVNPGGDLRSDTEIVPNFIPDDLAGSVDLAGQLGTARPDYLPAKDYLFFAGDLSNQKGLGSMLAAYRLLADPKPELILVGRPTPDLPATVPDGVTVHRGWPHERILAGFRHCIAAVLPSEWPDPCPTTVLEALGMSAPLITTSQGGIADMVSDDSAVVVPAGDVSALAAAMKRLIEDAPLRRRLADAGPAAVRGFRCGAVATQLEGIYDAVRRTCERDNFNDR